MLTEVELDAELGKMSQKLQELAAYPASASLQTVKHLIERKDGDAPIDCILNGSIFGMAKILGYAAMNSEHFKGALVAAAMFFIEQQKKVSGN